MDAWLLLELRAELPGFLGIPVVIQRRPLEIPKPGRDPVHLRAEDLRERMAKARKEADFQALLRKLNVATNSLSEDEDVFAVTMAVLGAGPDQDQARRFRDELAFLRRLGPQWDADELVARTRRTFAPQPGSGRGYLGVTTMDLYANESRYVFGMAGIGANCGVFSYRRYTGAVSDEPPDRERLKRRALKQALSSTGLMFGLPRCTDPTCARAYANSLAEHDAKQVKLCPQCQQAFAKYFGN